MITRRRTILAFSLAGAIAMVSSSAAGADMCKATALNRVFPDGMKIEALQKGEVLDAVSEYRIDGTTGVSTCCSHGGGCYPRFVVHGGRRIEVLRLTNCKISTKPDRLGGDLVYGVEVVRSSNSSAALREEDVDNRLLELGLLPPCAGNAAVDYTRRPGSQLAALTRQALEGNPVAIAKLRAAPGYCMDGVLRP